jgi:hypothetical protein
MLCLIIDSLKVACISHSDAVTTGDFLLTVYHAHNASNPIIPCNFYPLHFENVVRKSSRICVIGSLLILIPIIVMFVIFTDNCVRYQLFKALLTCLRNHECTSATKRGNETHRELNKVPREYKRERAREGNKRKRKLINK